VRGWLEQVAEPTVVDRVANLQEQIGTSSRPAHLPGLVHSPIDQESAVPSVIDVQTRKPAR
jgi:hypothetical protein